ncbi:CRISPR-associated helicase, Cas3 family [Marinactinospora thermotolerans DSM 45154]|uniref:CRISPR-associated helicase, Cas3 family n=1 Tax=Marinactinospora thermotolerans DSM 45154 TaxID=1122192 RepID=A0A1T4S4G6_9ACTN|nr:CRISPR-associated helicase/endonuclease Cas3 [Marinactinospora thermotolerans]SKA23125.1 CRISPR-associated helicase, Cas3 family [Marinactinospora thermotolerans DSM 45154]
MTRPRAPIEAVRIELYAPVASFRDPMFPGVSRCLPVPPPSTVRGMLAAATGRAAEPIVLGMAARAEGRGTDAETYHPIAVDGGNPAVAGRVRGGKGGTTLRERPFLVGVHLSVWVPAPEGDRIAAALRRPVWPLRLGRSQDLVHVRSITPTTLEPVKEARIGHALAPIGGHGAPQASSLRLAETVNPDRRQTWFGDYVWCAEPAGRHRVHGAYRDPVDDQAVWLHAAGDAGDEEEQRELTEVWAKSAAYSRLGRPETLVEHSRTVHDAARSVAERIASAGVLARRPGFWPAVETAALLHDAGKVAEGFQSQIRPKGGMWGERHEVLSLAYVHLLTGHLPPAERRLVAAGVAFHHLHLTGPNGLQERYPAVADWKRKFGHDPNPPPGRSKGQVPAKRHQALLRWYADRLGAALAPTDDRKLWELARDTFTQVSADWSEPVPPEEGLMAVLAQGAVTLADHCGSAHVSLQTHMPLPRDYLATLPAPYPHQKAAADACGHLVLCSPTGSGKTEAALAWASRQLDDMPGRPRMVWVLPYRASIDAARRRLIDDLDPPPGRERPDIAVLHATTAQTLLTEMSADDGPSRAGDPAASAEKARAQAAAMRGLFAQRVRVSTPHQLLRAAIAGHRYSSVLLEQANAIIVLDELHAYDPVTFGRLCAAMRLWERLGSRVAVLSATLAPPMLELVAGGPDPSLTRPVTLHRSPPGTAPDRHRLVLDERPVTDPASLDRVGRWLAEGHSVLVVANTVATAQYLYQRLAPAARAALPDDPDAALLLHSRFRACDRAAIEQRILRRHPERRGGEPARRGGLVVATQALEVSLCLDFDRGISELAPVEALAQRAGRVNRRGRHPEGVVEFRVHEPEPDQTGRPKHHPYPAGAIDAARHALNRAPGPTISEHTIGEWLRLAYDTEWGRQWTHDARRARDDFERDFLTFTIPFEDRSEYATGLDEAFDTVEILHADDVEEYGTRCAAHPLLAAELLIPIRYTQLQTLRKAHRLHPLPGKAGKPRLWSTDVPYHPETGLDLTMTAGPAPSTETIL